MVYAYVPNEGDAWHYTQDQLEHLLRVGPAHHPRRADHLPAWPSDLSADVPLPDEVADAVGPFLDSAELLGRRTAELHRALAAG